MFILCASLAAASPAAQRDHGAVAILLAPDAEAASREAAAHVADQLDVPVTTRTSTEIADLARLSRTARGRFSERYLIVLDADRARIAVLRPADGTMLSRELDSSTIEESPYAVSLAALELLEVATEIPAGSVIVEGDLGPERPFGFGVSLSAALSLTASPGHEAALAQPMVAVAFLLRFADSAWWTALGARGRFLGDADSEPGAIRDVALVDYERNDASLRLLLGRTDNRAELAIAAEAGASFTRVLVYSADSVLDDARRTTLWVGLGFDIRYLIGAGFSVGIGAGASYVLEPSRFFVRDELAIEEGRFRLHGDFGLSWEWR